MLTQTDPTLLADQPRMHADRATILLRTGAVVVALGIAVMTYIVFVPLFTTPQQEPDTRVELPAYDYRMWYSLPVQAGRTEPFQSLATEKVREITGRARFQKLDPAAIVLSWILTQGHSPNPAVVTDWEHYPFIMCKHEELRQKIFEHLSEKDRAEKAALQYVAPADLRASPGFDELLATAVPIREADPEKAHFHLTSAQLKAEELAQRLATYDAVCGRATTRLYKNALVQGSYFDVRKEADVRDKTPDEVLADLEQNRLHRLPDPFHFVALDQVPDSAWFSPSELRVALDNDRASKAYSVNGKLQPPARNIWRDYMEERMMETPQRYVSPERMQALRDFQEQVKAGQGQKAVDELRQQLAKRRADKLKQLEEASKAKSAEDTLQMLRDVVRAADVEAVVQKVRERYQSGAVKEDALPQEVLKQARQVLEDNDARVLKQLEQGVALAQRRHYIPDDPDFRMMHLGYLESRFPNVYKESLAAQRFPADAAARVLDSLAKVRSAYQSGPAEQFAAASQSFFDTAHGTSDRTLVDGLAARDKGVKAQAAYMKVESARDSGNPEHLAQAKAEFFRWVRDDGVSFHPYPGVSTIPLELTFNRVQPFMWAWVVMFAAVLALVGSMAVGSRVIYLLGFGLYVVSLGLQSFGFFTRISISGRAPVSDMYETVIWVAFMSAIFALVLELIYRRKVILMAGGLMSFLGLVLADQLPMAVDPQHADAIRPLMPVLRSNYWLTIHVLTIVSSYAAGTLAWGIGNVSLALLAFGKGRRETLKMLSQFTYRAIQIAVLLLAAGTFLGGWWAAESWGRFWGWDSKEVGALVALVCYVIPLHARYLGWVKDFGLAISAVLCYSFIIFSWYVINFVVAAGLHSYGFGGGGGTWVAWVALLNIEWVIIATMIYRRKLGQPAAAAA
jgi:ABC-type transport system involved in cytochrome c biogenesis permease subunit